ncbi:hypothetical protein EJ110_NYTH48203 [Nymphaea thermarum]|nr:hypothetical protein EJ110_NYTH48203 [Nymphaea thermarum]
MEEANVGYNEPWEAEEEEEKAYEKEYDDEGDSNLRTDLKSSRGRDRRGKGITYEGGRSGIMGRKRRGTPDIRARHGMRPPSGRVLTANSFQFQAMADAIASIGPGFKMPHIIIVDGIFNNKFWESCVKLLKVCVPLVKVLRLADRENRPSIGYLYEAMDKAKEAIRDNLKGKKKWTGQLHQPLHAAAYYLNPAIRFSPTFKKDREVMHGLLNCIEVLVTDSSEKDVVHNEFDLYDTCFRDMEESGAVRGRTTMRPEPWIEEEPATIFDVEDLQCFNLEAEVERFVDEGESAGGEYVGEDLQILDDKDEEEDGDEDDEDYES